MDCWIQNVDENAKMVSLGARLFSPNMQCFLFVD
jgi:hypothetical protein